MFFNIEKKIKAFTVAELAITITVIGVIAAITMPLAFRHFRDIEYETGNTRIQYLLSDTLDKMNSDQSLTGYSTTKDFAEVFSSFVSTIKTCPSDNLTGCFPETFKAGEEEFSLSDIKNSKFMGKDSWKTKVEGIVLKNGFNLLVAYNPYCSKKNPQNCVAVLYDLNSIEKDNIFLGNGLSDLGTFNAAFVGADLSNASFVFLGEDYSYIDCRSSNSSSPDFKYCSSYVGVPIDYSAGAKKACDVIGMKLPNYNEAVALTQSSDYDEDLSIWLYTTDSLSELGEEPNYWAVVLIPDSPDFKYNAHRDGRYSVVCIPK